MTLAALQRRARARGLRIPDGLLRAWLRDLARAGYLTSAGDDWQATPLARRVFAGLRETSDEPEVEAA